MMETLYCKVFVDSVLDEPTMIETVASMMSGTVRMRTVLSPYLTMSVIENDDFGSAMASVDSDPFLFYRYYLDIEPSDGVERDRYVACIGELLEKLWNAGMSAVAASDFEEELPRSGNYRVMPRTTND